MSRPSLRRAAEAIEQALAEYLLGLLSPALDALYVRRGPAAPGLPTFEVVEESSGPMKVQRLTLRTPVPVLPSNAPKREITYRVDGGPETTVPVDFATLADGKFSTKLADAFLGGENVAGKVTDYDPSGNPASSEFATVVLDKTPPDAPGAVEFVVEEEDAPDA